MKMPFLLASLLISSVSFAQQIRVLKVKGNKAMVEFSGATLSPGKAYNLGGGSSSSRARVASGSFIFHSGTDSATGTTGSTSASSSELNLVARYGWNMEQYEAGPILLYRNVDSNYQSVHYTSIGVGGFFDYNFTPNRMSESTIWAVTGEGTYGTFTPKSGSGGNSMGLFAGGTLKWFGLTSSTALRADLGYDYQKITVGSSSINASGFTLRTGIATYF